VLAASIFDAAGELASPLPPHAASTPPLATHNIMFLIVFLSIKFSTLSPVWVCGRRLFVVNSCDPVDSYSYASCVLSMLAKK
jgi:hypothetical protein